MASGESLPRCAQWQDTVDDLRHVVTIFAATVMWLSGTDVPVAQVSRDPQVAEVAEIGVPHPDESQLVPVERIAHRMSEQMVQRYEDRVVEESGKNNVSQLRQEIVEVVQISPLESVQQWWDERMLDVLTLQVPDWNAEVVRLVSQERVQRIAEEMVASLGHRVQQRNVEQHVGCPNAAEVQRTDRRPSYHFHRASYLARAR